MTLFDRPSLASFGLRVQIARRSRNMTRYKLSKLAEIRLGKLVLVELGRYDLDILSARRLAGCLSVSLVALLRWRFRQKKMFDANSTWVFAENREYFLQSDDPPLPELVSLVVPEYLRQLEKRFAIDCLTS